MEKTKFTPEQIKKYIDNDNTSVWICPFCGNNSTSNDYKPIEPGGNSSRLKYHYACPKCKGEWNEVYTLTTLEIVKPQQKE